MQDYRLGQSLGLSTVTLTTSSLPAHNHILNATKNPASNNTIANNLLPGQPANGVDFYTKPVSGEPDPVLEGLERRGLRAWTVATRRTPT